MDEDLDALEDPQAGDVYASLREAVGKARQARRELAQERHVSRQMAATAKARKQKVRRLRAELALSRAWAWAQFHGYYNVQVVDPHAPEGPAAPPEWLVSGHPPWPEGPAETAATPDEMLRALLGLPKSTAQELTEAMRRSERPFVLSADVHAEDDEGNGFAVVEVSDFRPGRVFPGAVVPAGHAGTELLVLVLRTELLQATAGRTMVLVTFRKDASVGDVGPPRRPGASGHGGPALLPDDRDAGMS